MILKTASLFDVILSIIKKKETEPPYSGKYNEFDEKGTYLCRQCGLALFRSNAKFQSECGWPSFDAEIPGAIVRKIDADGSRIEILCARCYAHLGHIFEGEKFTKNDIRYCVNSLSLDHIVNIEANDTEEAVYAAGCFWGVEYYFKQLPGVLKTEVGYMGGDKKYPTYDQVCSGETGHYEVVRVIYDPTKINYETLTKYFFEIHDPTQFDGQGPDRAQQYLSVIFYYDDAQKNKAIHIMTELETLGYFLDTKLLPVGIFWRAEEDHQNYYEKNKKAPYCHQYVKRFLDK